MEALSYFGFVLGFIYLKVGEVRTSLLDKVRIQMGSFSQSLGIKIYLNLMWRVFLFQDQILVFKTFEFYLLIQMQCHSNLKCGCE